MHGRSRMKGLASENQEKCNRKTREASIATGARIHTVGLMCWDFVFGEGFAPLPSTAFLALGAVRETQIENGRGVIHKR